MIAAYKAFYLQRAHCKLVCRLRYLFQPWLTKLTLVTQQGRQGGLRSLRLPYCL